MVGVPGKSKGCTTCRRRKKGCDQKRPVCGQCTAGGYVCGGYERNRTFILHPSSKDVESAIFVPYPKLITHPSIQSLDQTIVNEQCRGLFWDLYMPHGDCVVRDEQILRCGHPMNWAEMVNELSGEDDSLANAFSALSVSRVGKENQDARLVRESTKIYGKALKDMQLALYDPDRMHSDHVLVASMLLGLYETFESSALDSRSWLSHAQGAARLIQLRGPDRHRHRQAHHVFLGSRMPTIYAAIAQRRRTYLAAEDWLTTPWGSQHRTYFDRLVDLTTRIPGILEDVDATKLGSANPLTYPRKTELLQEMVKLQDSLDEWKRGVKKEGVAYFVKYKSTSDHDDYPFEHEIWFNNHLFVNAHVAYWCCSLALAETAQKLAADLESYRLDDSLSPADHLQSIFRPKEHASCIVQTMRYCLQPDMAALGTCIINYPANSALRFFSQSKDVPVLKWLAGVFKEMRNRGLHYNPELLEQPLNALASSQDAERYALSPSIKTESTETTRSSLKTPQQAEDRRCITMKFVVEDPSRYYIDTSDSVT